MVNRHRRRYLHKPDPKDLKCQGSHTIQWYGGPIAHLSKKLPRIGHGSGANEFMELRIAAARVMKFRHFFKELRLMEVIPVPTKIYVDNEVAINWQKTGKMTPGNHYADIDYFQRAWHFSQLSGCCNSSARQMVHYRSDALAIFHPIGRLLECYREPKRSTSVYQHLPLCFRCRLWWRWSREWLHVLRLWCANITKLGYKPPRSKSASLPFMFTVIIFISQCVLWRYGLRRLLR